MPRTLFYLRVGGTLEYSEPIYAPCERAAEQI